MAKKSRWNESKYRKLPIQKKFEMVLEFLEYYSAQLAIAREYNSEKIIELINQPDIKNLSNAEIINKIQLILEESGSNEIVKNIDFGTEKLVTLINNGQLGSSDEFKYEFFRLENKIETSFDEIMELLPNTYQVKYFHGEPLKLPIP